MQFVVVSNSFKLDKMTTRNLIIMYLISIIAYFMQIWWLLISRNWISSTKEIRRKSVSKLVMQPSFRAVGQTHANGRHLKNPKIKYVYGTNYPPPPPHPTPPHPTPPHSSQTGGERRSCPKNVSHLWKRMWSIWTPNLLIISLRPSHNNQSLTITFAPLSFAVRTSCVHVSIFDSTSLVEVIWHTATSERSSPTIDCTLELIVRLK